MTLPTLFKKTSNGKIEQWTISVEADSTLSGVYYIITEHGLVGGKTQRHSETVKEGKNLGKKNETTPEQQAHAQAKSEWTVKLSRKGYCKSIEDAEAGKNEGAGGIRPMLAKKFTEHGHKLAYPIYAQPKLDGIRCIAMVEAGGEVSLWSREQKEFLSVPRIAQTIADLGLPSGTILDGELYNHDLHDDFEKISSCVRKQYPASDEEQSLMQYHVYDMPSQDGHFGIRYVKLVMTVPLEHQCIKLVDTKLLNSEEELLAFFEECRRRKFEGCMARAIELQDKKGKRKAAAEQYEEGKRSDSLLKVKEFDEDEFPIVGVREGVGTMEGLAIFDCEAANGNIFGAKLEGELASLRKYLHDESLWKGKKLTVQYQGLTNDKEVPRFPVGKAVRDYE